MLIRGTIQQFSTLPCRTSIFNYERLGLSEVLFLNPTTLPTFFQLTWSVTPCFLSLLLIQLFWDMLFSLNSVRKHIFHENIKMSPFQHWMFKEIYKSLHSVLLPIFFPTDFQLFCNWDCTTTWKDGIKLHPSSCVGRQFPVDTAFWDNWTSLLFLTGPCGCQRHTAGLRVSCRLFKSIYSLLHLPKKKPPRGSFVHSGNDDP